MGIVIMVVDLGRDALRCDAMNSMSFGITIIEGSILALPSLEKKKKTARTASGMDAVQSARHQTLSVERNETSEDAITLHKSICKQQRKLKNSLKTRREKCMPFRWMVGRQLPTEDVSFSPFDTHLTTK